MAKKRLNRKLLMIIALVGMALAVIILFIGIDIILPDDPQPFLDKARELVKEARQIDEAIRAEASRIEDPKEAYDYLKEHQEERSAKKWEEAHESFASAFKYARGKGQIAMDSLKELAEMNFETGQYEAALKSWHMMLQREPGNYYTLRKMADYAYESAKVTPESQWDMVWPQVEAQADQLVKAHSSDPYGYNLKAHVALMTLKRAATQDPQEVMSNAEGWLSQVLELDENNLLAYYLQSQLELFKASKSEEESEQQSYRDKAEAYLREGIAKNPNDIESYVNLFDGYLRSEANRKHILVRRASMSVLRAQMDLESAQKRAETAIVTEKVLKNLKEQFQDRVPERDGLKADDEAFWLKCSQELEDLINRFPGESELYMLGGRLVLDKAATPEDLSVTLEYFEKAIDCGIADGSWYYEIARVYAIRGGQTEEERADLERSFALLRRGLYLPEIMDMIGPRKVFSHLTRWNIIQELVDVCARLAHLSEDELDRDRYLSLGDEVLIELQNSIGKDHFASKASAGTLALEKGEFVEAIKDLYQADEMLMLSGSPNPQLKRKLFEALRGTEHHSAAVNYAAEAIKYGLRSPRHYVEYVEAELELPPRGILPSLLQLTQDYEMLHQEDGVYLKEMKLLQARILLRLGRREEARKELSEIKGPASVLQRRLLAQVQEKLEDRVKALEEILQEEPANKVIIASLYKYYLSQDADDASNYERARVLVEQALQADEENLSFQEMKLVLQEPDPNNINMERLREIKRTVLSGIKDSFKREISLGQFYQELARGAEMGTDLETTRNYREQASAHYLAAQKIKPDDMAGTAGIFDIAIAEKDWPEAERLLGKVSEKNRVLSLLFEGNLKSARKDWSGAANRLEEYIQERPVSYSARAGLAQVYRQMGRFDEAIKQAKIALQQNSSSVGVHRMLVLLMHQQNEEIGIDNMSLPQIQEIIIAANNCLRLARNDLVIKRLKVMYYPLWITYKTKQLKAEQGVSEEAKAEIRETIEKIFQDAVRICRTMIARNPAEVTNWKILSSVIYQYSQQVESKEQRNKLLAQVEQVYKQGLGANPGNAELTESYAAFLQEMGRGAEAEQLMSQAMKGMTIEQKQLAQLRLAQQYMRKQAYERARQLIEQVLKENDNHRPAAMLLAELFSQTKNYKNALILYENIREQEDSDRLIARHVELLLNAGQFEKANELLSEMEQKYPEYEGTMLLKARAELHNAKYAAAVAYADKILAKDATNQVVYLIKAESLYYDQKYREALDCITVLRDIVGNESNYGRILLARTYWSLSRREDAMNELRAGLRVEPDNVIIRKNLINFLKRDNRWSDLDNLYKKTMELFPNSIGLHLEAADAASERGDQLKNNHQPRQSRRQYEQALQWISKAGELSGQSGKNQMDILARLLSVLLKTGNYEKALQMAENTLKGNPDNVVLLMNKSEAQYLLGKKHGNTTLKREALKTFERALELVSDDARLSSMVLSHVTRLGNADEVIAWSKVKLTSRPDWREMHLVLAKLYRGQGKYKQEIAELLVAQKNADEALSNLIEQYLSIAYQMDGQEEQAIASYRRLLKIQPDNKSLINNLAYSLLGLGGHSDEAVQLAQKAYDLDRNDTDAMDTYAWALLEQKEYERAELIMRRAIQQIQREGDDVNAEFYYHLGQALKGQGRKEDARQRMRTALDQITLDKVGPGGETLRKKIMNDLEKMNQ